MKPTMVRHLRFLSTIGRLLILAGGLCLFAAAGDDGGAVKKRPGAGQPKPPPGAVSYLIRVPIPIAGEVDTRLKAMIGELLERWKDADERPTLVLEFGGGMKASSEPASSSVRCRWPGSWPVRN